MRLNRRKKHHLMYLRYRAKYFNEAKQTVELGFFKAAVYLSEHAPLTTEDRKQLDQFIHFFDHQLPIPDYYQSKKNRQAAKSATSWFKDSAQTFIRPMNELANLLEQYQIEVERISAKKTPGKIIYEDDYQITVIPFRDVKKHVI